MITNINRQAHFSEDGKHRYWLLRSWKATPRMALIIGLNPSTADDKNNDPTIRRCVQLAQYNGYGGFIMCNLFTLVTASPAYLQRHIDEANTPKSDETLIRMIRHTHITICAWGSWSFADNRARHVMTMIKDPQCFVRNLNGSPKHPLYLPSQTRITPYHGF